jgi:hypothetical protein
MLRSRQSRREEPLGDQQPDTIASLDDRIDPEEEALLADSVGPALLVVLEMLAPPPSGSRSYFTICSPCPSRRSLPSSGARPPRPGSWPAAPAAGCEELPPIPAPIAAASARSWMPSSRPRGAVTSGRSWRCSTRMPCSEPIPQPSGWGHEGGPWRVGGGRDLRWSGPSRSAGAGGRSRGGCVGSGRTAAGGVRLHPRRRQGGPDRSRGRPRPPRTARRDGPQLRISPPAGRRCRRARSRSRRHLGSDASHR